MHRLVQCYLQYRKIVRQEQQSRKENVERVSTGIGPRTHLLDTNIQQSPTKSEKSLNVNYADDQVTIIEEDLR